MAQPTCGRQRRSLADPAWDDDRGGSSTLVRRGSSDAPRRRLDAVTPAPLLDVTGTMRIEGEPGDNGEERPRLQRSPRPRWRSVVRVSGPDRRPSPGRGFAQSSHRQWQYSEWPAAVDRHHRQSPDVGPAGPCTNPAPPRGVGGTSSAGPSTGRTWSIEQVGVLRSGGWSQVRPSCQPGLYISIKPHLSCPLVNPRASKHVGFNGGKPAISVGLGGEGFRGRSITAVRDPGSAPANDLMATCGCVQTSSWQVSSSQGPPEWYRCLFTHCLPSYHDGVTRLSVCQPIPADLTELGDGGSILASSRN